MNSNCSCCCGPTTHPRLHSGKRTHAHEQGKQASHTGNSNSTRTLVAAIVVALHCCSSCSRRRRRALQHIADIVLFFLLFLLFTAAPTCSRRRRRRRRCSGLRPVSRRPTWTCSKRTGTHGRNACVVVLPRRTS